MFTKQQKTTILMVLALIGVSGAIYLFQYNKEERATRAFFNAGETVHTVKPADFFRDDVGKKGKNHVNV